MNLKRIVLLALAVCLAVCMTACGGIEYEAVTPEVDSVEMCVGDTVSVPVVITAKEGSAPAEEIEAAIDALEVQWSVFDERVATVDEEGNLTAIAAGSTDLTIYVPEAELNTSVKVVVKAGAENVEATDVMLNTTSKDVPIMFTILPEGAKVDIIDFVVADEGIAKVEGGKLTAVAAGETELTIVADKASRTVKVTVQQAPTALSGKTLNLKIGDSAVVDVKPEPAEVEVGTTYTYSCEDKNVAFVEVNGKVTGVGEGETVIRVWNELDQMCEVKVKVTK